ncbi:MAG: GspE/PulE family protein [Planctomycetota bacterium]|nr:GspE/PulE family protein [Planctomycetota bacterium]
MELVTEGDIQESLARQKKEGGLIGKIMVGMGCCSEGDVTMALAVQNDMNFVDLSGLDIPIELLDFVTDAQAHTYRVVPLEFDADTKTLIVAMDDPTKIVVFDELRFALQSRVPGIRIQGALAPAEDIDSALQKFYSEDGQKGGMGEDLAEFVEEGVYKKDAVTLDADDADSPAVVKLLNFLLATAIRDRSSDIHLEPFEERFQVRYRVDGALLAMENPPRELAASLISRIKVLSKLDISETRLPQDGRIELMIEGRSVDLRVSTLPTMFGESCVMRILDRSNVSLDLDNLGMRPEENEMIKALIAKPNGIVLVTGPTGSGKTTTLYSCLNYMNNPSIKIITTEDPVEYDLPGVMQCQVNEEVGLTYGAALRSILRQDPDMILVGEIRDRETGGIAVEAALTGHLVLSTLHTNDAPSATTRMLDLGLESFLIAATLEAIIAQRLVRKDLQQLQGILRAGIRAGHGAGPAPGGDRRQEVRLRQGLFALQQHRLQGPHGAVRDVPRQRRNQADDHGRRQRRRLARGGTPPRHAHPARVRTACHLRLRHHRRRGDARDHGAGVEQGSGFRGQVSGTAAATLKPGPCPFTDERFSLKPDARNL